MTTVLVGVKDFRQNMAKYTKKANSKKYRVIVLRKNKPIFEIKSVDEKLVAREKLKEEIAEAREQVKRGEVVTHEEIMKDLGLL
jgi:PHD/YefM family antitoxin component YafN of YafNO toxin-antitoxin module